MKRTYQPKETEKQSTRFPQKNEDAGRKKDFKEKKRQRQSETLRLIYFVYQTQKKQRVSENVCAGKKIFFPPICL